MKYQFSNQFKPLVNDSNLVFVFGSNEGGHHGAGSARWAAENAGAIMRVGFGHHGRSFALPTKGPRIENIPIERVADYVYMFLTYARHHPELIFMVTAVGCGLAGFKDRDIAPLFQEHPDNCWFDTLWQNHMEPGTNFWGTYA